MEYQENPRVDIEAELKQLSKFIDPINFESVEEKAQKSFEPQIIPDSEFSKPIEINQIPESEFSKPIEINQIPESEFTSIPNIIELENQEIPEQVKIENLPEQEFFKTENLINFSNLESNNNLNSIVYNDNVNLENKINAIDTEIKNVKSYIGGSLNDELIKFMTQVKNTLNAKNPKDYQSELVTIPPTNLYIKKVTNHVKVVPTWL